MDNIRKMGKTQPPQPQTKVDLKASKPMVCEQCKYDTFLPAIKLRKISKLLTGTPQDMVIPIDIFVCAACGAVNRELLPTQIKELESENGK